MPQVNNLNYIERDITTEHFNNVFGPKFTISQNVEGAIVSFFEQITESKSTAKAMAASVVYTAKAQSIDPMEVMRQFIALPKGQINSYLTMFLNLNRVSTSMLGMNNRPMTNKYVARTIRP